MNRFFSSFQELWFMCIKIRCAPNALPVSPVIIRFEILLRLSRCEFHPGCATVNAKNPHASRVNSIQPTRQVTRDFLQSQKSLRGQNPGRLLLQSVNQSISQSVNQSISQSVNQSISQSVNQSISQSVNQSISQSVNQSISHSVNQSISQSVNQSISQSVNQSINQSYI